MIIISYKPGQLGNQLFLFAHVMSWCLEHNAKLYNPAFHEYQQFFPNLPTASTSKTGLVYRFLRFLIRAFTRTGIHRLPGLQIIRLEEGEKQSLEAWNPSDGADLMILHGWLFRAPLLLQKHHAEITHTFSPESTVRARSAHIIKKLRSSCDIIVGIHLRRGDYKTFEDGQFFFDDDTYAQWMKRIELSEPEKTMAFVLCSNEKIELTAFTAFEVHHSRGTAIEDLHLLSSCDRIAGPPSTFSLWASYFGKKPLLQLVSTKLTAQAPLAFSIPTHY